MERIYGIDFSKEKFDVCFNDQRGSKKLKEVKNAYKDICKFLTGIPVNSTIVAEYTGVYGELFIFLANCMNVRICIETGYNIKHSLGLCKGKTDKLDAERIKEFGERFFDKLKEHKSYSADMFELKELYSLRNQLVKERKMLVTHGKEKDRSVTNSLLVNKIYLKMITEFTDSINKIEEEILTLITSNSDFKRNFEITTSVKGVGTVTSCELIIKTENFEKIDTAKKAASYAGVCPFPNSSGKMVKKSKVSPMSDKKLKTLLYMCSKSAVAHNKEFKLYYQRKMIEGKQHYLIMNNIANKLLRTIYKLIETGEKWDPNYICSDPRLSKKVA
jgi:transposase